MIPGFRPLALLLALAVACPPSADAAVAREGQVVMGTVLTVTVVADTPAAASSMAAAAIEEARRWDDALTIWRKDGELGILNSKAGKGKVTIGERLEQGLNAMLDFAAQTGGAFDPAVRRRPVRSAGATTATLGIRQVLVLGDGSATLLAGAALDPGGAGKGLALDAMVALLKAGGATAAFLDFGGSSQTALGVPPGNPNGWMVLVAGLSPESTLGTVELRDESLSTSRAGAQDTTPILDPSTGESVTSTRLATVRASGAGQADAWSTALVVLGRGGLQDLGSRGMAALVQDEGGVASTAAFFRTP